MTIGGSARDRFEREDVKTRTLVYGPAKTKKSWWVGTAAEAGYNVMYFDVDKSWDIFKNLSPEAQDRIRIIDPSSTRDKSMFSQILGQLLKGGGGWWNIDKGIVDGRRDPQFNYYHINLDKLTTNDVVCVDSWTALSESIITRVLQDSKLDLTDLEKGKELESYYDRFGKLSTMMHQQLMMLQSHVVIVGHEDEYIKYRDKKRTDVEFRRTQIVSTSRPNAKQLAKAYSSILHFYLKGPNNMIDSRSYEDKDGGSRTIPPALLAWEKFPFAEYMSQCGARAAKPTDDFEACKFYAAGVDYNDAPQPPHTLSPSGNVPLQQPPNKGPLASLFGPKS